MSSISHTSRASQPTDIISQSSNASQLRWLWAVLVGLLATAIFFRSVLPRLPRVLFRGKLRIKRAGLRGVRGIEYRSKGFHNDSAAFSRNENQLEVKIQRIYASFHLPYFLCRTKDQPSVVPRKNGAVVTIHVQGVGVRLPRNQHDKPTKSSSTAPTDSEDSSTDSMTIEQREERRLQQLMSSPPMSPSAELYHPLSDTRSQPQSQRAAFSEQRRRNEHDDSERSALYLTCRRAGTISIRSMFGLATWLRCYAAPKLKSVVLRALRAALYILTSGLPMLTSLVSIEIDRIEVYIQEVEAVARIGRAGITFSMSPDSLSSETCPAKAAQDGQAENVDRASYYLRAPSWSQFSEAMRLMPTKVGSGARGAANYLVAGMSPSTVTARLRLDSIDVFEANFKPVVDRSNPHSSSSRRQSGVTSSTPSKQSASRAHADPGVMSPSQSDAKLHTVSADTSIADDSFEWSSRPTRPKRERSNSASRLSKMSTGSLRGFADRWADWALEPLVDSDFHAESGWTRQLLDKGFLAHQLQTIPSTARIVCISGVTDLTANLLVGSNLALGGDGTLASRLVLGNISVGLDAAHRIMCLVEERKARRTGLAPSQHGLNNDQRSVLSKHLVQQRPSASAAALRMVSSVSLSLPSISVTASSDAMLSSNAPCQAEEADQSGKPLSLPSRELAISLTGFHFELSHSDPAHDLHRRWLGTCGISSKSATGKGSRGKSKGSTAKSRTREGQGTSPRRIKSVEHRRVFLAEAGLASFEIHCRADARDRGSRLLFVGDISITARSAWTPFGLFPASDEFSRLLFSGDPNEHAAAIEASIAGVETDVPMQEVAALVSIAKESSRRRQKKRQSIEIDDPPPKTDLGRLRRLPRISAGVHIQRISLLLSAGASREEEKEAKAKHQNRSSSHTQTNSRKLTLSVPNVDLVFFGEYRDEYVKRPVAEKRAAYKALKSDSLEWPLSGRAACEGERRNAETRRHIERGHQSKGLDDPSAAPTQDRQVPPERYTEMDLTMEETIARMQELQQKQAGKDRPPFTMRRPSLREPVSGSGKARLPGYNRRSSMAAETRFNIRYQFETCLRVDAVESFLSLNSDSLDSSRTFVRSPSAQGGPGVGSSQHHLLAMHSFEVHGSGRIPGNLDSRASALGHDEPRLSAQDTVAEFRASIEDVDFEAWQACALDAYADMAATILQAKQDWNASHQSDHTGDGKQPNQGQDDAGKARMPTKEPQSLVERLPGGLALYLSVGRTIAHLGGLDRRVKDDIARGVGFEAERIVIEYAAVTETKTNLTAQKTNWGARTALELSEDLQLQAISLASRQGRVGLARIVLHEAGIFPILDAALATQQHTEGTASESFARAKAPKGEAFPDEQHENEELDRPATSLLADSVWTFDKNDERVRESKQHRPRFRQQDRSNFIFFMPFVALKAVVRPPQAENKSGLSEDEVFITAENTDLLAFKIDLLHTYCLLLAFSTFKNLISRAKGSVRTAAPSAEHSATAKQSRTAAKLRRPSVSCRFSIKEVHTFVTLPKSVRIFMRMRRLEVRQDSTAGLSVSTETIMGAVESPKQGNVNIWEEAVRLRDWRVTLPPKVPDKKLQVQVNGDAALIRIPYGYAVNPIIDNTSVAFKATKQLVHQFLSENDDAIIIPYAEDPKMLPDIQINLRVLTLEAQDDPFETRLNLIWRAGLAENAARLEREAAFAAKVEAISASKIAHSATSFRSRRSDDSIVPSIASVQSDMDDSSSRLSNDTRFTAPQEQHVSYEEARIALNAFNSSSWVRRYTNAQTEQKRRQEAVLKNIYGRFTISRSLHDLPVTVLPIGKAAPLFRSTMYRLSLNVGQASFPIDHLREFIHEKGDGIPKDTPFSLLVPMHMKWEMEEWRITLRDYPLPLLHVPPTHRSETDTRRAWCFEGDVVIAEQLGGPESIRHVPAVIVPAATGRPDAIEYGIVVHKVAMPVKMYGAPTVHLKTPFPTRMVWGQSLQPAIQDVMRVIDGLTPPPHDPSPKLGVWDKLPLILHGHINFKFQDEGGFNIHMKGSRDPYSIQGEAAGWVKSWKGGVELRIGYENEQKEFFQIQSHEYVLAVPDLCDYVDHAATGVLGGGDQHASRQQHDRDGEDSFHDSHDRKSTNASFTSSMYRYMKDPTFRKIVIKLTNGVRWGAGLHGERTCDDETCPRRPKCKGEPFYRECRNFDRIDHWKVITKTREHFASLPESERKDSYRGWRSHHIHLSMSVYSPKNGLPDYGGDNVSKLDAGNNFYFSPLAWQHFFAWMRLFNHAMGLPIRIGKLFPDSPPPSPKFGRFLGTIKYRLDLAPLFITHQYRQFSKEDWARGFRTHVGIKARIDSFCLDMHQRQQETIKDRPELGGPRIVFHKPLYEAEVSCETINLKAIAARLRDDSEISADAVEQEIGENVFDDLFAEDVVVPDEELDWIDMNDLVELDSQQITDPSPKIRMFPAMICPQFNYYRKVDSKRERRAREMQDRATKGDDSSLGSTDIEELLGRLERSKFGNEKTHNCMVGKNDKPYGAQRKLAQERLQTIRREIDRILSSGDGASATSEGDSDGSGDQQDQLNDLHGRERILSGFISHLGRLQEHLDRVERAKAEGNPVPNRSATIDRNFSFDTGDLTSLYHDLGTFDNRYVAHNPILFFSNVTRTLLLKYYYSSRLRRGYAHHMTATAVRYIRDLLKKKDKRDGKSEKGRRRDRGRTPQHVTPTTEDGNGLDILHEMLEDTVNHVFGKDADSKSGRGGHSEEEKFKNLDEGMRPTDGISDEFNVEKSNVCLLLKPQVVLRSDIDDKSTVILTALRTRLQNYTVQDESCADDSVNAVVLRRNFFGLDNLQCYHPTPRSKSDRPSHGHARQHGFVSLPLETLADMHGHSRDFERIVPHTNASMYYDKFNKLRLSDSSRSVATFRKDGKPVMDHLHHHMDMILLNCPRFSVSANSEHFAALYNVVTDLILYRDPAHRDHAKRLEEMMFSYDFTDVAGLADIVTALQVRIRDAQSLVDQYRAVSDRLNDQGRADFLALLGEVLDLVIELNLIMDAITTSQDSKGGADREKKSALRFMTQAQEVAWNMLGDEAGQLVAKLALRGISFSWLNKADNSAANTLSIQDLQALNVDPDAMFAEIITKHLRAPDHPMAKEGRFVDAMWSVLPPVGGISIVDTFEFNLHPVKIQIELFVGRKIMDYIFGTKRQREKEEEEQKRIEDDARRQGTVAAKKKSPFARLLGGRKQSGPDASSTSSQTSRRPDTSDNLSNLSAADARSRSASSSDLLSVGRPSSDTSRDDDANSLSGKAATKGGASSSSTLKTSPKSRPASPLPSNGKQDTGTDRPSDQYAIAQKQAAEMRARASRYRTFVYVKISETIFSLSYKGEKQKSITDLYDLVFRTPNFEYHNSTFGYVDLADNFKKDVFKAAWNQKSTLLRDIITHRPNRKRNAIESIRAIRQASRARESLAPLDISVDPPTPTDQSSFDGSSHLVESPTDAFSYRVGEGSDEAEIMDSPESGSGPHAEDHSDNSADPEDEPDGQYRHVRTGTGQTLAGQIRDAWGRNNAASSPSDEPRHSTSEIEDSLADEVTPLGETAGSEHTWRFPTLTRSHNSDTETPTNERRASSTTPSPSPHLQLPNFASPVSKARRSSLSTRSNSPSFKLNKLIPKKLRPRATSSTASTSARNSISERHASPAPSSPLNDHAAGQDEAGHHLGVDRSRATSSEYSASTASHQ